MSSCGHSTIFYFLPPTVAFLQENFSLLIPDLSIDRGLPRCRFCDLIDAQVAADIAEAGPPGLENEADIARQISELEQAITEDSSKETENALSGLQEKLNDAKKATHDRFMEAWKPHWAIWGLGEGPDVYYDEKEGGGSVDEIEIEFPPEEESKPEVETKVESRAKAPVKTSGKKSGKRSGKKGRK